MISLLFSNSTHQIVFQNIDSEVYHFCFVAPLEIILERIHSRHQGNGTWEIKKDNEYVS